MTREEILRNAEEMCITQDEIRGFCRGAEWTQNQLSREWISVNDRLPEKFGWYQVYTNQMYRGVALYDDEENNFDIWFAEAGRDGDIKVTHWMPLPTPPSK